MCRFRFKLYQAVVQRCRMICFKFMYWLRLGAVVPVWFCISSILQYQSTEPMYCPFPSTFRRCIFVRQVELVPGRFALPSGHLRTQPARAFPAQTVKTGWTLLSTGSVVVLVLQALIQRFLPGFFMNRAVRKAGQRLKRKEPAPARPLEEEYIKDFINSPQGEALSTPSFLVVSGSQGIGKSTMLNNLMCEHVKNGKRVLPLKMSSRPGEDLKLNEALPKALQAVNLPRYYPEQVEYMLEKVNETCKHRTGSAVVVYLQLTTKSRGDKFSRDACDDIASTLGAFARNITYDNAACKFILEVSDSAVADIITERFNMSRLVVVRPLPFEDFTSVVKEVAKQGNDFRTLNKVLADDKIEEVLKHYYIRTGGNFRDLNLILENVSRAGQKGADAVIEQVEQWYKERVEPIQRKLDDQEVKDYLLKVAEAGPMGYLPESDEDTKMKLKLLREEPADCVLRRTTNLSVALKHWHFVAKLFQEDEQKLRDAGYMWASPVKKTVALEMFCVLLRFFKQWVAFVPITVFFHILKEFILVFFIALLLGSSSNQFIDTLTFFLNLSFSCVEFFLAFTREVFHQFYLTIFNTKFIKNLKHRYGVSPLLL